MTSIPEDVKSEIPKDIQRKVGELLGPPDVRMSRQGYDAMSLRVARAILAERERAKAVSKSFDEWYGELEGVSVRAERLTTSRAELEAAYAARVAAERERAAKIADAKARDLKFNNLSARQHGATVREAESGFSDPPAAPTHQRSSK